MGVALSCDCRSLPLQRAGLGRSVELAVTDLEQTEFWNIRRQLIDAQQVIEAATARVRSDRAWAAQYGRDVVRAQQMYSDAAEKYQAINRAVFGDLDYEVGMGAIPIAFATASKIVALAALVYTIALLVRTLDAALRTTPRATPKQANLPDLEPLPDLPKMGWEKKLEDWLGKNWGLVAAGVGGVIVVSLVGGGRRR